MSCRLHEPRAVPRATDDPQSATSTEASRFAAHRLFELVALVAGAIDATGCIRNDLQALRVNCASTLLANAVRSRLDPLDRRFYLL
jgi:hypothetical protein